MEKDLMSKEAIAKRKAKLAKLRMLAFENWEIACHEGDVNDFEYFVKGFISGYREGSNKITIEEKDKIWLKSKEVQQLLKCSSGTLQNYRHSGKVTCSKIGGTLFYNKESILALLNK